jgi:hypothetical protein
VNGIKHNLELLLLLLLMMMMMMMTSNGKHYVTSTLPKDESSSSKMYIKHSNNRSQLHCLIMQHIPKITSFTRFGFMVVARRQNQYLSLLYHNVEAIYL